MLTRSASVVAAGLISVLALGPPSTAQTAPSSAVDPVDKLNQDLLDYLTRAGFPKDISLKARLGRDLDQKVVDLGRDLFFDRVLSLSNDNTCAGCHAPRQGFGDTQSIAIGMGNNYKVGIGTFRIGPRNQRRTPMVLNNAFYPKLMWNGRFAAISDDPFDNSLGFSFPPPEGVGDETNRRFPAKDEHITHLLMAQAQIPSTELPEMAGFRIERPAMDSSESLKYREPRFAGKEIPITRFSQQKSVRKGTGQPSILPHGIGNFFNEPIRGVVLIRLNAIAEYRKLFESAFPDMYKEHKHITMEMVGAAIAEFEFSLTFVDAPIDRFAAGRYGEMTESQKRGGLLFFGKARCVECHAVAGKANGMFSDFENHVVALPQIVPRTKEIDEIPNEFGSVQFVGPGHDEDFGLEDITSNIDDRYKFRTSPLRNIHLQPAYGHNGAWVKEKDGLERIVRHHLDPTTVRTYDPMAAGVADDLRKYRGPTEPVLARLSPRLVQPITLTDSEVKDLVCFVRDGLADPKASPAELIKLVPSSVPSGLPLQTFE